MKTKSNIFLCILVVAIVFFSCKKDETASEGASSTIKQYFPVAMNISFDIAIMAREALIDGACHLFSCNNVLHINKLTSQPGQNQLQYILTFDFGSGCTGTDGVVRKGRLIDSVYFLGSGGTGHNIYFENYEENNVKVMGIANGKWSDMFSTQKFSAYFQLVNGQYYTTESNGGLIITPMPELLIIPQGIDPIRYVFVGKLTLVNLNQTGYQDDVYSYVGDGFAQQSFTVHSDTYIAFDASKDSFHFDQVINSTFDFACPDGKRVKGGTYTLRRTQHPESANPTITDSEFSFPSEECR